MRSRLNLRLYYQIQRGFVCKGFRTWLSSCQQTSPHKFPSNAKIIVRCSGHPNVCSLVQLAVNQWSRFVFEDTKRKHCFLSSKTFCYSPKNVQAVSHYIFSIWLYLASALILCCWLMIFVSGQHSQLRTWWTNLTAVLFVGGVRKQHKCAVSFSVKKNTSWTVWTND